MPKNQHLYVKIECINLTVITTKKILSELQRFSVGLGSKPSAEVELCFGEEFPDPKVPKNRKLIVAQVGEIKCSLGKKEGWETFPRLDSDRAGLSLGNLL